MPFDPGQHERFLESCRALLESGAESRERARRAVEESSRAWRGVVARERERQASGSGDWDLVAVERSRRAVEASRDLLRRFPGPGESQAGGAGAEG